MIGEARAEHTYFAGAGDVNEIGPKAVENFTDDRNMPRERWVEAEIFFECEGEDAARQFESPDIAVLNKRLLAITSANAQKWKILPARECFEVATGVRYPVDFVKGVRKVRYSWKIVGHLRIKTAISGRLGSQ